MKALWLEDRRLRLRDDVAEPVPAEGEALVRVLRAGICGTDLALLEGLYPFTGVPGHEFVGIVAQGSTSLAGRRVVCAINIGCGQCRQCRSGNAKHCSARQAVGIRARQGAFAEWICLPEDNLHRVPDRVSTDAACFAEPMAAALDVRAKAAPGPGDRVVVVGAGRLGQLVCRAMAPPVCGELVAVGRDPAKLACLEGIATRTLRPEQLERCAYEVAVECTGNPRGFSLALDALRPQGTLVLKSTYRASSALGIDTGRVVVDELRILGSRCGSMGEALTFLERDGNRVAGLVSGRFALEHGIEAFAASRAPGALKILLDIASRDAER